MAKILVIGAGVMGTAITVPAVKNGHDITLVGTPIDNEIIDIIKNSKIHPNLNIELKNTKAINSEELKQDDFDIADVIVIGISSPGIDWFIDLLKRFNAENKNFLIVTKGLYINNQGLIDILPNKIIQNIPYQINITAVTGPCKAIELAQQYITNICFVNEDRSIADKLSKVFKNDFYIIETLTDLVGGEFCAALKNVFAIMVGGAQTYYNDRVKIYNPESGIFSHCIRELAHIVKIHKGEVSSAYGLPGLGDLHVTSGTGRNGSLGKYLGEGKLYSQIMSQELKDQTVEGAQLIFDLKNDLIKKFNDGTFDKNNLPIFFELIEVITADKKLSIPWEKL